MAFTQRRFLQLKPSQLTLPMAFPQRENPPPLSILKEEILEYDGLLFPLIVRPQSKDQYLVLDGRRRLQAVWELQDEGHEKMLRWLPSYVIESTGPVMDLKLFLLLNKHAAIGVGEYERTLALIEEADAVVPTQRRRTS
jgi:ParB-like chromosome segregation protein Spo0J